MGKKAIDLTGMIFGRLKVVKRDANDSHGTARWLCLCECGNEKVIRGDKLRTGEIMSCGCYQNECRKSNDRKAKIAKANTKHGLSNTRLYYVYDNMIKRCYDINNVKYKNYGQRGITVCDEWKLDRGSFYEWVINSGYQDGLTIDRVDVNKGYSPDNCRWATPKVQANNKTNNNYITYNNETRTIAEWADITNIPYGTLWRRKNSGWSDCDIISK